MKTCSSWVILLALAWTPMSVSAQDTASRNVKSIDVTGLSAVSEQLVRSHIELQTGRDYNPTVVARDLRRLYSLGHFDTIRVDVESGPDGLAVTYVFSEKRNIESIKIIGNDKLRANKIRGVITWKEGDAFAPDAYDEQRKAILKLYESKGFANTTVDIGAEDVGQAKVRVVFTINEGRKARIHSVVFDGNQALSDRQLKKGLKTKRGFWFVGGKYNEEKFEMDLKKVVDKYGDAGHLDAEVKGTQITYTPNGKKMDIHIAVVEGPEFKVESIEPANNVVFDDDEMMTIAKVHAGDVHNKGQVARDADEIAKGYQDSGYVNAEVTPQVTLDREKNTTHIVYNVKEGDLKYLKQIDITGNSVTKDEVIRREMLVSPGDRVDGNRLTLSRQQLENTHYFDTVRLTLHDIEDSDLYTNLLANVEESKTGSFNFGMGYSSEESVGGFAEFRLNNFDIANPPSFAGGGQIFSTRLYIGTIREQYNLSFTDPEIFGYPLGMGFDVFDESYRYSRRSHFTEESLGGQIRFIKRLSPSVTLRTAIRYSDVSYHDIASEYTPEWRREFVESNTLSNSWSIMRKTLDHDRDPSRGSKHELVATIAGFGADNNFYRFEHDSTWYFPLSSSKKWILSFRTREGWAEAYGSSDRLPISERFFVGGTDTVRGYENRDIGPKIKRYQEYKEREAIGGSLRLIDNLEVKYKVTNMLRLYAFVDAGGVWWDAGDFDFGDIKFSSGLGLGFDIPRMGPLRVDWGVPINPDSDQVRSGRLHLMTGFAF
ncbi:MAG TPA: outer membrane protein assembly factor BamA [Candidatus Hydrogenedentes bacterium]|nr:outer membrane protein assembly factor BamA [Candidatus Hydrogenedentota bacterium]